MSIPLWITEADVADLLTMPEAVPALREGLVAEATGGAVNMVKTHAAFQAHSTLHAIGAVYETRGVVGTKTWAHTEGGATPLLILYDSDDGALLAVIEAFALGQLRTGGVSGVATDLLARPDAKVMALAGTGKQSLAQIAAVAAVRTLKAVRVWSPTPAKREAFAAEASQVLQLDVRATDTLEAALEDADVVTLATRARAPFVGENAVPQGAHVNAVGAIVMDRAEFEPALLDRCAVVAADSVAQVRNLSREFNARYGDRDRDWARVRRLSDLVAEARPRPVEADLTLFKAMGIGVGDLALGAEVLDRARAAGVGRELPPVRRAAPRLISTSHGSA